MPRLAACGALCAQARSLCTTIHARALALAEPDGRLRPNVAQQLLHEAPDAAVLASPDGTIVSWNMGAEELLGHSAAEALGQSLTSLIVPSRHQQKHDEGYARVMAGEPSRYGRRDLLRVPALRRSGEKVGCEFSLQLVRDADGAPIGSLALMRDVSKSSDEMRRLRSRVKELEAECLELRKQQTVGGVGGIGPPGTG